MARSAMAARWHVELKRPVHYVGKRREGPDYLADDIPQDCAGQWRLLTETKVIFDTGHIPIIATMGELTRKNRSGKYRIEVSAGAYIAKPFSVEVNCC